MLTCENNISKLAAACVNEEDEYFCPHILCYEKVEGLDADFVAEGFSEPYEACYACVGYEHLWWYCEENTLLLFSDQSLKSKWLPDLSCAV